MYDAWGIADGYYGVDGRWRYTPVETRDLLREAIGDAVPAPPILVADAGSARELPGRHRLVLEGEVDRGEVDSLPADLPIGYHQLIPHDGGPPTTLIVAPRRCPQAPWLSGKGGWGVAAQIYSLWRPDGWGIGDLADVSALANELAERGGSALLLSPLHAPSPTAPHEASPYYASSRRWLNPMLIPMIGPSPIGNGSDGLIDRNRVWPAVRRALFERFRRVAADAQWRQWADDEGDHFRLYALWTALAERLGPRWREWPTELRHPQTAALASLLTSDRALADACDFHRWVQWLARRNLDGIAASSPVTLIGDLAVGSSPDGADTWIDQDMIALDVSIGAPPDPFNRDGQMWGLPPTIPSRLRAAGYLPFIEIVRAALRGMGGLRIDHVMGLFRQFWIPTGSEAGKGTYVASHAEELLAIVRVEATRAGAFIIGEDLGNVEQGVRDLLHANGMLGTKLWWFDPPPSKWTTDTLAMVTTHDLPTIMGVRSHTDGSPEMAAKLQQAAPYTATAKSALVAAAPHIEIAKSAATLCLATLEDLAGCTERPNTPGTSGDTHPNWCRRMAATTAEIFAGEPGRTIIEAVSTTRPG
ncbi:MAG: 4-alpha-glucanotransferase [Actinobacteria bacterium]|nr:4-alpha-glucanotransferase [Actinomycetota bacterium]